MKVRPEYIYFIEVSLNCLVNIVKKPAERLGFFRLQVDSFSCSQGWMYAEGLREINTQFFFQDYQKVTYNSVWITWIFHLAVNNNIYSHFRNVFSYVSRILRQKALRIFLSFFQMKMLYFIKRWNWRICKSMQERRIKILGGPLQGLDNKALIR